MRRLSFDVAVIGGGASGAILVLHLLRTTGRSIAWICGPERPARGIAYSTEDERHLLNVPSARLSALADRPDDFERWLAQRHGSAPSFALRRDFALYLDDRIAAATRPGLVQVRQHAESLARAPGGWLVTLRDGSQLRTPRVVLATGHGPPVRPAHVRDDVLLPAALWDPLPDVTSGTVLVIGTGLTMVDAVLSLARRSELRFVAFSRHGMLPNAHRPSSDAWTIDPSEWPVTTRGLVSAVRREIESAARAGVDWRAVIDALRPATQLLWQRLPHDERRRFLRHARRWWDVRRHRLAPDVARSIDQLRSAGRLELLEARLHGIESRGSELEAVLELRGTKERRVIRCVSALNCTGPGCDPLRSSLPLLPRAIEDGLMARDPLGFGFAALPDGRLLGADGRVAPGLFALGPPLQGTLWETTAIPEIRTQAAALADRFAETARPVSTEAAIRP